MISVDENQLPLILPEVKSYLPTDDGNSPLARNLEWKNVNINGIDYTRETNTMPQWAGSCWYFLRFLDPKNETNFASEESIRREHGYSLWALKKTSKTDKKFWSGWTKTYMAGQCN